MSALWGPWRVDPSGGFMWRHGVASSTSKNDATNEEPSQEVEPETTPALPERKDPPACERRVNSAHTDDTARKLIASVFGVSEEGDNADEPD